MYLRYGFCRFQFNNDLILYQQVYPITNIYFYPIIFHRKLNLGFNRYSLFLNFMNKTGLICSFQKAWTEGCMYCHSCIDYLMCNVIDAHSNNNFFQIM